MVNIAVHYRYQTKSPYTEDKKFDAIQVVSFTNEEYASLPYQTITYTKLSKVVMKKLREVIKTNYKQNGGYFRTNIEIIFFAVIS